MIETDIKELQNQNITHNPLFFEYINQILIILFNNQSIQFIQSCTIKQIILFILYSSFFELNHLTNQFIKAINKKMYQDQQQNRIFQQNANLKAIYQNDLIDQNMEYEKINNKEFQLTKCYMSNHEIYQHYQKYIFPTIYGNSLKITENNPQKVLRFHQKYKMCYDTVENESFEKLKITKQKKVQFIQPLKTSLISQISSQQPRSQIQQKNLIKQIILYQNDLIQKLNTFYEFNQVSLSLDIDNLNFVIPRFLRVKIFQIKYQKNQVLLGQNFSPFSPRINQIYLGLISLDYMQKLFEKPHPQLQILQFSIKFENTPQVKVFKQILTKSQDIIKWSNGKPIQKNIKIIIHLKSNKERIMKEEVEQVIEDCFQKSCVKIQTTFL